ncbi:MAG: two-component regulator propeller domain-containing protein [Ginsengibacter sp.]
MTAQQQNYVFQHLTTKDGLASDIVNWIFQDSKGFYWIGGNYGVDRFDGKNFYKIKSATEDEKSHYLLWPKINPVEDKKGNVWTYFEGTIYVFQPLGKVDTIKIKDDPSNTSPSNIINFCMDNESNVWICTVLNFYKYDNYHKECILWLPLPPSVNWITNTIYDDNKKGVWIAINDDILFINIKNKRISKPFFNNYLEKNDVPKEIYIEPIWMDSKQNLWFGAFNGLLYKYNTITYKKEVYNLFNRDNKSNRMGSKTIPAYFVEDKHKHIWIGCYGGGLYCYDEQTGSTNAVGINSKSNYSLDYNYSINTLYIDNEENIWVGTDKGTSIFNPAFQQFTTVDENNTVTTFPKIGVTKIYETRTGNVLVGTRGKGWVIYDTNFILKKHIYAGDSLPRNWDYRKNIVTCFTEDHKGKIWIGYQHGLVGIFNPVNKHVRYIDVPEFNDKPITDVDCDAKGNIWFGLYSGFLGKWDVIQHKFFVYKDLYQFVNERTDFINDILINRRDEIWVATFAHSFYRFDPLSGKIMERFTSKKTNSVDDNNVTALTQINDSVLGVASGYKGFQLFNQKQKTFVSFNAKNGLLNNEIYGLTKDRQNNLWISSANGLFRMNAKDNKVVLFDEEDGLLNKQFLGNITILHDGRMAIPTTTGFVYFSPAKVKTFPAPPDVQIASFKVVDRSLSVDSILSRKKEIQLEHTQNFLTIGFVSISFLGRNTTQYYYQLQGIDKKWIAAGTQRFANYTNLSPGHYIFKVKCENRNGIPSKNITEISIYISPPWWLTWWSFTLYILIGGTLIYIVYRSHIRQLESKQAAQIKIMVATQEEERERISRDLHDDIGTKLSALKLFLSSLNEKASATGNAEISSLAESSEQFIKEAMQDVRQLLLNLSPTVLEEFGYTTAVEGLVNKINETKQIHFSLVVFGMAQRMQKEYEMALYRITQELINNVLKHAEAKNVSLQIGQRDEKIILMMEDDGKGFDVNAHKEGYGLHNLDARTNLMQGAMTIDSQPGKGTSVLIEIPYNFNET